MTDEPTERDVEALAALVTDAYYDDAVGDEVDDLARYVLASGWFAERIAEARRLPTPDDGCACHDHPAPLECPPEVEYEPACPVHSEHLWDPRQGMWVLTVVARRDGAAEAWDQGMRTGTSRAMRRMSDEPSLPLASDADNPYRGDA